MLVEVKLPFICRLLPRVAQKTGGLNSAKEKEKKKEKEFLFSLLLFHFSFSVKLRRTDEKNMH